MEFDCKMCVHEKVCDLWLQQERQDASCFCLDECDYFEPTLTPPNEGGKDKNVPTNGPLTLEELRLMTEPTPVWWDWVQGWVLARKGMIMSWNGGYYNSGELRGDFYRRPPEGEEET